ncbi:MAG: hypothetical protein WCB11_00865, partial [Terriglobales bacterium]
GAARIGTPVTSMASRTSIAARAPERALHPTATYRKVTGGCRSTRAPTSTPLLAPPPDKAPTPSTLSAMC